MMKAAGKYANFFKSLGPGLLWAGAAIGVSHLVQSTRAGANFGFALVWAVVFANVFKYPFFEYGPRYAAATPTASRRRARASNSRTPRFAWPNSRSRGKTTGSSPLTTLTALDACGNSTTHGASTRWSVRSHRASS